MSNKAISSGEYLRKVESKIRTPIINRENTSQSIGLMNVVGTHGTDIDSIIRLAQDGQFSGGLDAFGDTFHVTPNLLFKGWAASPFFTEIQSTKGKIGTPHPVGISIEYATNATFNDPEENKLDPREGVVITFGKQILELVRLVDIDDVVGEPEVVLNSAPPLEAIRGIHPVDINSAHALRAALRELR
jgi:hypothetical protein